MPNPHLGAGNQHPEDVEPVFQARFAEAVDPDLGRSAEFALFSVVDSFHRRPEPVAPPGFDLDKGHHRLASHDEIDVAVTCAEAMSDHRPAVATHPSRGDSLALQSEGLSLLCHGRTVQRFRETPSPESRSAGHRNAATSSLPDRTVTQRFGDPNDDHVIGDLPDFRSRAPCRATAPFS